MEIYQSPEGCTVIAHAFFSKSIPRRGDRNHIQREPGSITVPAYVPAAVLELARGIHEVRRTSRGSHRTGN